jgi:DNA-directed RNA polymerase subunit K/omega
MLMRGAKPLVESDNRPIVSALREVAGAKVKFVDPREKAKEAGPSQEES